MLELNKIYNMDCLEGLKLLDDNSIDLVITSPPYYNAREYSQWSSIDKYMQDMRDIFSTLYNKLRNHKTVVVNVGDIVYKGKRYPLGALFTMLLCELGYEYIDDYIWDKGEPQSKRHLGNPPYPFYQYPVNCYEHILIFAKHKQDKTRLACPDCHQMQVCSNGVDYLGIQSWECKNPNCPTKSNKGRGKRFSARSLMMQDYQTEDNLIPTDFIKEWHRDIIRLTPVVKINSKGKNIVGHSAPYPKEIPEMAIRYFSGVGDTVVDIFNGSGTTCLVAKELNRNYIGFEINKEYCKIAEERINGKNSK